MHKDFHTQVANNISLNIPKNLIGHKSHDIDFKFLHNKKVVGLAGYSKSGKDTLGKILVDKHGFTRVAFGDVMKRDMNTYFKNEVTVDLYSYGIDMNIDDIDFLNPSTREMKEVLRPYMKWFGQELRRINGEHYWTNRALSEIGENDKVVITDIRRESEIDIFIDKSLESLLVHVSQYGLTDEDELTLKAIRRAQELWLFRHTILVDSRIPDIENARKIHIEKHIDDLIEKFPTYFVNLNV